MKIDKLAYELAGQVSSAATRSYALAHGWERIDTIKDRIAVFAHPEDDLEQLLVPLNPNASDYSQQILGIVETLSEVEKRNQHEVLHDLLKPEDDVIRFRVASPSTSTHNISLIDALSLLEGARRLLSTSMCNLLEPKKHHPRLSKTEARQFVDSCQLGQTERGSYTVAIACPLRTIECAQQLLPGHLPLGRQATNFLWQSAYLLLQAIEHDEVSNIHEKPPEQTKLSSNLCDAILRMHPKEKNSSLEISASWAPAIPQQNVVPAVDRIVFRSEHLPVIEGIYEKLLPAPPSQSSFFFGYVDGLNGAWSEEGLQGEVTLAIMSRTEERLLARVELKTQDYQEALLAHGENQPVQFEGVLHRGPRICRLSGVRDFRRMKIEKNSPKTDRRQPLSVGPNA